MANSLFSALGGKSKLPGQLGNMQEFMSKLNQFKKSFQGDPREQVQQLLNSGQMTQDQYNQLSQMATEIQEMLKQS